MERQTYQDGLERGLELSRAEIERLKRIEEEAKRIKNEAHYNGDHFTYDLMRTVLGEE